MKHIKNPYYDEAVPHCEAWRHGNLDRFAFVQKYAWSIPTEEVVYKIAQYAPRIVEIGAGTGYWAWILSQVGCDVLAFDRCLIDNFYGHTPMWYNVIQGGGIEAFRHSDRALLLSWPPYAKSMAYLTLKAYKGNTLIYIGEDAYGCTGDNAFHALLGYEFTHYSDDGEKIDLFPNIKPEWSLTEVLDLPQWSGIRDSVHVYHRM